MGISPTSLETLLLSFNQLTSLPPELGNLTTLQRLDLEGNQLTSLPPELGNLTTLQRLDLEGNPLCTPPSNIIGQGTKAILAYLHASQRKSNIPLENNQNRFNKRIGKGRRNTEMEQAEQLLQSGQERAAGTLAGVALEAHLKKLCDHYHVPYSDRMGLQVLIQTLQDEDIITVDEARHLTRLTAIRNKCAHSSPVTAQEVSLLVREAKKFIDWVTSGV